MLFLTPTDRQLSDLFTLMHRGLGDMANQSNEGDLVEDGYSKDEIAAFDQLANDSNGVGDLLAQKAAANRELQAATHSGGIQGSLFIAQNVLQAYAKLTGPLTIDTGEVSDSHTAKVSNLTDLLADLMHYAEHHDIDFNEALAKAGEHVATEQGDLAQSA